MSIHIINLEFHSGTCLAIYASLWLLKCFLVMKYFHTSSLNVCSIFVSIPKPPKILEGSSIWLLTMTEQLLLVIREDFLAARCGLQVSSKTSFSCSFVDADIWYILLQRMKTDFLHRP